MEFKGLRWAGNIYQKFEAMCLEVEEVMYEDSVKYVENQVQKVGVSVKKFYSEVMQDLLPPSCVDPVKVAGGDLSLNPYAHNDFSKKLKPSMHDNHKEIDKKTAKDELIYSVTSENKSFLRSHNNVNLHSQFPPRELAQNKCSELYSVKNKKVGVHKRPIGIKRISQNRCPQKISHPVTSSSGDDSSRLECDMRSPCLVNSDVTKATSSLDFSAGDEPAEALNGNTPSVGSDKTFTSKKDETERTSLTSDKILSSEFVCKMKDDPEEVAFSSDKISSAESVRQKNDNSMCSSSGQGLHAESNGTSVKEDTPTCKDEPVDVIIRPGEGASVKCDPCFLLDSKLISNTRHNESACKEVTMSCEDNFDMEVINNEDVAELGVEIFGKSNMDGSCVLVEENQIHSVPLETQKNKSYKKKIREAFQSKLRSSKKHNQHKVLRGENDGDSISPCVVDSDKRKSQGHDSFDSEWELL